MHDEYIYHHGIKGMKWGVRRFQNADGTLTPAGQKRYDRNVAYRDKLAGKAAKRANRHQEGEREARRAVKDLRKNGVNSETYKKWKAQQEGDREWDYEHRDENRITVDNDTYVKKYQGSGEQLMNAVFDKITAKSQVRQLIDQNNKTAAEHRKSAKKWMAANQKIMSMDVNALTKKSSIRKSYLQAMFG